MTEWIDPKAVHKTLSGMYDYCEKCEWLFYGYHCSVCGSENKRIGEVHEPEKEKKDLSE